MASRAEQLKSELIERVAKLAATRLDKARAVPVERFIRAFYANVPPDDILADTPENLFGAALSLWNFGLQRPAITYMRGWGQTIDIPLIMFVIEGADVGPIVVDTGADVDRAEEFHRLRLEQSAGERPDAAVRSLGIDPNDVRIVINTHLHWDHSSHNHLFPNAAVL